MKHRILYRLWAPYRRRCDRYYELRWELWFHALKAQGIAYAARVGPVNANDWHERYVELTTELEALR